ncbi:MAG: G1 family endopeptidase [Candidatus Bathyarchaeota archaeon]|nr:G1 family endopeptidase [Candidatus Bathyarchaeota archaeon]
MSAIVGIFDNNPEGRTIVSLSWAGYIISQSFNSQREVTAIEASWIIPQVNASAGDGHSSAWIGIGGQTDKTLIQVGTEHDVIGGQEIYVAWYEMLPNLSVTINGLKISPGDTIAASLTLVDSNANMWNIKLSDNTNGQTFSLDVNYKSSLSSGEWIMERPTVNKQISTLSDFGQVSFSSCYVNLNGIFGRIDNFTFSKIQMINQLTAPLASVSTLGEDGSSFTVSYVAGN